MPSIDAHVADVLDRQRTTALEDEDEDALIAELEEDDSLAMSALREKRLEQLHAELSRAKVMKQDAAFGTYKEIKDEKEILSITTSTKLCVVHFMKPDFTRCRIMDEKLAILAPKHFDTRFVSINVENAPWLVVKLGIQVLPCVISFIDGISQDRILGFEGVGQGTDKLTVQELEERLLSSKVLLRAKMTTDDNRLKAQKAGKATEDDYDDDEWD
ncbi:hypothetical protein AMS68_004677 [Peltaster fructicola]|uniref:Thioredoxin domain-containing protein n=1 Tax=Peltaster fructicola TaxID=286661 RepID=A0A6H0XXL4_9PEZI|nr:hypothetical protein AMS68_004677 [Peltaster fructicola]